MNDLGHEEIISNDSSEENQEQQTILLVKVDKNYFVFVSIYGSIFLIGLVGNLWALKLILPVFFGRHCPFRCSNRGGRKFRRQNSKRDSGYCNNPPNTQTINNNLLLYTLILCIIDLVIVSIIPLLIADYFADTWLFGKILCKSFWIIENGHKIASKLILMAMSVDSPVDFRFTPCFAHFSSS
uniref:G-protein coupled receptors family 1 profile domain-containing protein n=1 Tax=Romanomermis culicivorax TaxID=13658 RepID=A0A915I161_ROMCU